MPDFNISGLLNLKVAVPVLPSLERVSFTSGTLVSLMPSIN